jgi:5'-nucleotidase
MFGFSTKKARSFAIATGALALAGAATPGCNNDDSPPDNACPGGAATCQVRLTLLHTADIHSRLLPYDLFITQVDADLGLGTDATQRNVGGIARMAYILGRERARADKVLHLDSGDCFQGAPIFNFFSGEPEVRAQSAIGTDAMVIGNHEFDRGALNVATQMQRWASFPLLAANYKFDTPDNPFNTQIANVLRPFTTFNRDGLKIAVIGMGNLSSMSSIFDTPNRSGITPINTTEVAQFYIDLLRPSVDVIVMLTHLGLEVDERMIRETTGIDVVLGGHNHIVINPPQKLQDCSADPSNPGFVWVVDPDIAYDPGATPPNDAKHPDPTFHPFMMKRACKPRNVLLSHSGAFSKYVGRIDLVFSNDPKEASPTGNPTDYDPINGFELVSDKYVAFPIEDSVPEDPVLVDLLQPYRRALANTADLDILVGFSPNGAKRTAPQGGDSPLGNLVATSMWLRLGVQTDFSMTNSTGIRTDLIPGPVTVEQMYNIFPFDNSVSKMQLSGFEVQEMFDFIARRSASRSCASQAQIAGARVRLNCSGCSRPDAIKPCTSDNDCITLGQGGCDPVLHQCSITACAEQVYIGHSNVDCTADTDCPKDEVTGAVMPGSCDTSLPVGVRKCLQPISQTNLYELATSNYLANGGSGFRVLQRNTTQFDTKIQQRDALIDYIRQGKPCGYKKDFPTKEGLKACATDTDCTSEGDFVCACPGHAALDSSSGTDVCNTTDACGDATNPIGRCVLRGCRDGVAQFHNRLCSTSPSVDACKQDLSACALAGEECKLLACVDDSLGAASDNRVEMIGR